MKAKHENPEWSSEVLSRAELTLEDLLDQARSQVWRWLSRRVADPEVVADLTQEILIKTWEARRQWDPQRGFWRWLLRIMVNHFGDWQRRRGHDLLAQSIPWEASPGLGDGTFQGPSPEDVIVQDELHWNIRTAVLELPPKYREILWLYYFEDWSCSRIANTLGLTVSQVEGRLFRGRSMLRSSLKPLSEG
jgi:RNA polymerase sigma-70 factor (ECF subfamily)